MKLGQGTLAAVLFVLGASPFLLDCGGGDSSSAPENPASCTLSTATIDFGQVSVGQTADRVFAITNSGGGSLTGTVVVSCPAFSLIGSGAYALGAGQSQSFTLRFAPTAIGAATCTVATGSSGCPGLAASGTGATSASCQVAPTVLDFGSVPVGQGVNRSFSITNMGTGVLSGTVVVACEAYTLVSEGTYSLGAGEPMSFTVRFAPVQTGTAACTIATGDAGCPGVSATGVGLPAPSCQIDPTSLDFGTVALGESADRTFVITNAGGGTLIGTVSSPCSRFRLTGSAGYSLAGGQSQTVTVRFTPSQAGPDSCTIATGAAACQNVRVYGLAVAAPSCQVDPTALDFGNVDVGQAAERSFTITNSGGGTLAGTVQVSCAGYSLSGDSEYSLTGGQSRTFTLRFAPAADGVAHCTVETGATGCASIAATATGVAPPLCQVAPDSLDFGNVTVGQSADRSFTITNAGGGTVAGTVSVGCAGFSLMSNGTYALAGGQSRTFVVRFSPFQEGSSACTVPTGTAACPSVAARGNAIPAVGCAIEPTALDFGSVDVGESVDRTFTITNTGGGNLEGTVTVACPGYILMSPPAFALSAGQSQSFTVRFSPFQDGPATCAIDTGAGSCPTVTASGQGTTDPACQVAPATLDFGNVDIGQSAERSFTITNTGGGSLSGTVSAACPGFGLTGTGVYALAGGQAQTFTLRFTPTQPGSAACAVGTGSALCPGVSASGTGVAGAACQITPAALDFGQVTVGESSERSFTLTNTGGTTLADTIQVACAGFSLVTPGTYSVSPGQSRTFTVRFSPVQPGLASCQADAGSTCGPVGLTGTGVSASELEDAFFRIWIEGSSGYYSTNIQDRTFTIYATTTSGTTDCGTDIKFGNGGGIGFKEQGHQGVSIPASCDTVFVYFGRQYNRPDYNAGWGIDVGTCTFDDTETSSLCSTTRSYAFGPGCRGNTSEPGFTLLQVLFADVYGSTGYANHLWWFFDDWKVPAKAAVRTGPIEEILE